MKRRVKRSRLAKDKRPEFRGATPLEMRKSSAAGKRNTDPQISPTQQAFRRAIESQMCPFCPKGPFAMLPVHTNKAHGVDKWELRDLAGLTGNDPLCSEDTRRKMAEKAPRAGSERLERATAAARGKGKRKPQRWTKAGLKVQVDTVLEVNARMTDEERRELMRKRTELAHTDAAHAKRAATIREKTLARNPHGTRGRYRTGCKCDLCRKATWDYQKALKTRKVADVDR
jgi:hypothetical protein